MYTLESKLSEKKIQHKRSREHFAGSEHTSDDTFRLDQDDRDPSNRLRRIAPEEEGLHFAADRSPRLRPGGELDRQFGHFDCHTAPRRLEIILSQFYPRVIVPN